MNQLRSTLNEINRFSAAVNISIGNLNVNEKYKVERLEKVTTKYGPSVIGFITKGDDILYKVYLPKKFVNTFSAEFTEKFNQHEVGDLYLTYHGLTEKTFNVEFS